MFLQCHPRAAIRARTCSDHNYVTRVLAQYIAPWARGPVGRRAQQRVGEVSKAAVAECEATLNTAAMSAQVSLTNEIAMYSPARSIVRSAGGGSFPSVPRLAEAARR